MMGSRVRQGKMKARHKDRERERTPPQRLAVRDDQHSAKADN